MTTTAYADTSSLNLALPSTPGSYQTDSFRTGDLDCSNAIGSATNLEVGVTGIIAKEGSFMDSPKDIGLFARIVIPLGARPKARIDCSELYQLELQQKRLEVMQLERELEQMRALQFEN